MLPFGASLLWVTCFTSILGSEPRGCQGGPGRGEIRRTLTQWTVGAWEWRKLGFVLEAPAPGQKVRGGSGGFSLLLGLMAHSTGVRIQRMSCSPSLRHETKYPYS